MSPRPFLCDVTLRDGSHVVKQRYSLDDVREIAGALDAAGVDAVEVGHGDGLGASGDACGVSRHADTELIETVRGAVSRAAIVVLFQPKIGTRRDLADAATAGATYVRVATLSTEAASSARSIAFARELGLDTSGFLMMAARATPAELAGQARLMESYGAQCVYLADSSGAMTTPDVEARVSALRKALKPTTSIGIHAHENMSISVANSIAAVEAGATRVDASLAGMGAGAGNTPIEAFVAVIDRLGWEHEVDIARLIDAAEDLVRPLQPQPVRVDRDTLSLGYSGVHGSFLVPAREASHQSGIPTFHILSELGRRQATAGQEHLAHEVAQHLLGLSMNSRISPKESVGRVVPKTPE